MVNASEKARILKQIDEVCGPASRMPKVVISSSREDLIAWLCWADHNGCWTDEDSIADGHSPLTFDEAWQCLDQMSKDD